MPEDYARETDDMLAELKRLQAEGKLLALPELTAAVLALGERLKALEARVARLEEKGERLMEGAAIAFLVYCLPGIIALLRHHHQTLAIAMLNLLLGWTVLGWVIALVWACTAVQHTAKEA